ncbi:hypothetical protein AAVH_09683 [Aphelenchoides avenae]|nr:hypothetical protein AAVH_09683 [Aphelenchus avenae]
MADGSGHYGMCAASTEEQVEDYGHGSLIVISAVDADDVSAGIDLDHLTVELRKRLNRAMGCDSDSVAKCSSVMSAKLRSLATANDGCLETENPTPKLDADYSRTLNLLSNVDRMMEFTKGNSRTDGVYVSTGDLFTGPTEMKFRSHDKSEKHRHAEL